jgi:hypothetical protein
LFEALKQFANGETARGLRDMAGLNGPSFGIALKNLMKQGRICQIVKNGREYDGYKWTGK